MSTITFAGALDVLLAFPGLLDVCRLLWCSSPSLRVHLMFIIAFGGVLDVRLCPSRSRPMADTAPVGLFGVPHRFFRST